MKFKFLTGDVNWQQYGGKFISRKLNNGEFDYYLVMDVINFKECVGDESNYTYNVSVCAIAPLELEEKEFNSAVQSGGWDGMTNLTREKIIENFGIESVVEIIAEYMGGAVIYNESGNNLRLLMKNARKECDVIGNFLFGFAMDRYQNGIGSTGWDILRGDILGGLNRYELEQVN